MRRIFNARSTVRRAFERYEDRLVLSTSAWAEVCHAQMPDLVSALPDWVELAPTVASSAVADTSPNSITYVHDTYGFHGEGQTVAIIDSGIAFDHVALGGGFGESYRVVGGWDFTEENDAIPYDDGPAGYHGTHVAGIIASQDALRPGLAPSVDLVALRVFNDSGLGHTLWVERALEWIHTHQNDFRFPITAVNLSLGAGWNGSSPPAWAALEDELAQLTADGIFVAVAAGNSFEKYGLPGLAYPAASPYVVPVASLAGDGQLSEFSQRQERALAAPGEMITSTVPDFILGSDGNLNDWAAATGTSMASPYVAGASLLVREAMQFVGYATITQADIYQQLRDTADLVYDSVTRAWYHRVNLTRAIDTLIPPDDYGSTVQAAFDLGTFSESRNISGQLARLDDRDAFRFTAAVSGELNWTAVGSHSIDVTLESLGTRLTSTTSGAGVRVETGCTYTFVVSARDHLANYDLQLTVTPDTLVSLEGDVLRVQGTPGDDTIRVSIGSTFSLELNGHVYSYVRNGSWQCEITGQGGSDQLVLLGSEGNDELILHPGKAEMRGADYELSASGFATIEAFAGAGQDDVARLYDSHGNDLFVGTPTESTMSGAGFLNKVSGFDRVYGYASSGLDDVARLYDSPGHDLFDGRPDKSFMRGSDYYYKAKGFDRVYGYSVAGGTDLARLYDSQDDLFDSRPDKSFMRGSDFYNKVKYFSQVYAFATGGDGDIARLWGSNGADQLFAWTDKQVMRGDGFYTSVRGFDFTYADSLSQEASGVAEDTAFLYGSPATEQYTVGDDRSLWQTDASRVRLTQFERIRATGTSGGRDVAELQLRGPAAQFIGQGSVAVGIEATTRHELYGFDRVALDIRTGDLGALYLSAVDYLFERIGL